MRLSKIYSDGMVLQREKKNTIRGAFTEGEVVSVSMDDQAYPVSMNAATKEWRCEVPEQPAGGPHTIVISNGTVDVTISDVLFGDVFILGGQSNMELPVNWTTDFYYDEIRSANFSGIRHFEVPKNPIFGVLSETVDGGYWAKCDDKEVLNFSAIGFYFAKYKQLSDGVPVGLIQTAVGGAPVESLMGETQLLESFQEIEKTMLGTGKCNQDKSKGCLWCYREKLAKNHEMDYVNATVASDTARQDQWHQNLDAHDQGLLEDWMNPWPVDGEYLSFHMPSTFYKTELESFRGSVWLQKIVNIPADWCDQEIVVRLGTLMDGDVTYVNGVKVGEHTFKYPPRFYVVQPGLFHEGENVITVRLIMDGNIGGAVEKCPYYLMQGDRRISLEGDWNMRIGYKTEGLEGPTFFNWAPTALYGSMLYPLHDVACKAILFYQGESNCEYPQYYGKLLKDMVAEWRSLFGQVPFYMAEVTYWLGDGPVYESDPFANVRKVQHEVVNDIPDAYLIPTYDLGMYNDLHPQNKKDVAIRFLEVFEKNEQK